MNHLCINDLNFLSHDECDLLIQSNIDLSPAAVGNPDNPINEDYRKCSFSLIDIQSHSWLIEKIYSYLKEVNSNYFRYILKGITELQIIKYDTHSFYKKHIDTRSDEFNNQRKLTFVVQLSNHDDYTEGDLLLHATDTGQRASRDKGAIIVFPSFVLHEVTPILSGTRYSLIGWCFGPEFK